MTTNSFELRRTVESKILPFVEKPMRYTGSELNMIQKDLQTCSVHGVLCFPDLYDIGMSHFGLQILYHIVNNHDGWALSRCFNPWPDMEKKLRELNIPLYNLEYFTPLSSVDWIGFSVQYELQYTNIVNMLDLAGIPLYSSKRDSDHPLIVAGGPCMGNPEPLSPFIDVFVIGDGEETVVELCEHIEYAKKNGTQKDRLLNDLSDIPAFYVPSLYKKFHSTFWYPDSTKKVKAAKVKKLLDNFYPGKPLVPLMEVVHHRLAVEVMRGCTRGCRFCGAGMWYRPVRERQPAAILDSIRSGMYATGWRDIGLLSLSTADYSCLWNLLMSSQILKEQQKVHFAIPSTRIDALTENQIDLLHRVSPMMSLTVAPEAGSERLRRVINKDFTDLTIYQVVDKIMKRNIQSLKLYFMIGLPTENDQDIDAIIVMITKISGMVRAASRRSELHVAISPFSPKPHTPFQREKMESVSILDAKSRYIKNCCKNLKNVKVSYRNPEVTLLETVMTRGDEAVGNVILAAWKNGARFDGWDEFFNLERWIDAAHENGIQLETYCNAIHDDEVLPWNAIVSGVSDEFLKAQRDQAYVESSSVDCRNGDCISCGVCGKEIQPDFADDTCQPYVESNIRAREQSDDSQLFRYRIWFSKGQSLRFLGHLDMSALIQRAFCMANVKLAYTNGFHPHPRISFGPPLPLGVFGNNEAFEVISLSVLNDITKVNELLPQDLVLTRMEPVERGQRSLFDSIRSTSYSFKPLFHGEDTSLETMIKSLLEKENIMVKQFKNGQYHDKDIRQGIMSIKTESQSDSFIAELSFGQGKSCKPLELIAVLFPDRFFSDFLVERLQYNQVC